MRTKRLNYSDHCGNKLLTGRGYNILKPYICMFVYIFVCLSVHVPSCPTLCNPMDCSPLGFSIHGIFQSRLLEWVAIPSPRGVSLTREPASPALAGGFFTTEPLGKPHVFIYLNI